MKKKKTKNSARKEENDETPNQDKSFSELAEEHNNLPPGWSEPT